MHKGIAVFDFDGTITKKDTFVDFLIFSFGKIEFYKTLAKYAFHGFLYAIGIYPNYRYKELIFGHFFKNKSFDEVKILGDRYAKQRISEICYAQALEKIEWHLQHQHQLVLLTASPDIWIKSSGLATKFTIIATEFELINNVYTGKIKGKNCHGKEKIPRLLEKFDINNFQETYGYGDSKADLFFINLMKHQFYKPFRD